MLVNFLMEAVDACHNAGLQAVATVCDRGANSQGETAGYF
jgi:citrate lyase beta subunit